MRASFRLQVWGGTPPHLDPSRAAREDPDPRTLQLRETMLNWVRKLLGGVGGGPPTSEVHATWAKALHAHLEGVCLKDQKAPVLDLVAYVCTGEPTSALAFASRSAELGSFLGFGHGGRSDSSTLAALNRLLDQVPADFVPRLIDTAPRRRPSALASAAPPASSMVSSLLREDYVYLCHVQPLGVATMDAPFDPVDTE